MERPFLFPRKDPLKENNVTKKKKSTGKKAAILTTNKSDKKTGIIEKLTSNFSKLVKHEQLEGRDHLVVPMVMMVEGVHEGSNGPLFYPADELTNYTSVWNSKPIVVYHPEQDGQSVSACDPIIFNSRKVGVIMNTTFEDGKLKAEAWLEKDRLEEVDERILEALEKGEMMEISTGLFTENELVENGEWNGEAYTEIARNYRPDHLAILPDQVGACSIADGGGLLRNKAKNQNQPNTPDFIKNILKQATDEILANVSKQIPVVNTLSHDDIRQQLSSQTKDRFENKVLEMWTWVMDVFEDFYIFEKGSDLFKLGYSMTDNQVTISDDEPEEVSRVTRYMNKTDGSLVGNVGETQEEPEMDKATLVGEIIANAASTYEEADKDYLMSLDDDRLNQISDKITDNGIGMTKDSKTDAAQKKQKEEQDGKKKTAAMANNEQSLDEWLENAPAAVREQVQAGITANKEK